MAYQTAVNRGNLFKNDKEIGADYQGELNVEGVLYFIDAYLNDGVKGKYLSIKLKKKNKQEGAALPEPLGEDDIPF